MPLTDQIPEPIKRPTPLYAVVGAGDAVVERLRGLDIDPKHLQAQAKQFPTKANQRFGTVVEDMRHLPDQLRTLPERAQTAALHAFGHAGEVYAELAERGEGVVHGTRKQAPIAGSQEAEPAAKKTTSTKPKSSATSKKSGTRTKKATDTST